jgi:tetratricopeptide (TPR) repeat protein
MTSLATPGSLGFRFGSRPLAALAVALALVAVGIVPSPGHAATKAKAAKEPKKEQKDAREMEARQAFAAGEYKDALDIYTKLYAEKLHPTYLRNIARCYQNLGDADHAISSFREYLRKAKDLTAQERQEVEGFIAEVDKAQKQKEDAAAAAAAADLAKRSEPPPLPPERDRRVLPPPPPPPPPPAPTPFYAKGWFWGVVGGVVVAGVVGTLWATGTFSPKDKCVNGYTCP